MRRFSYLVAAALLFLSAQAVAGTLDQLPLITTGTYPLPDPGTVPSHLWISQGCNTNPTACDFGITPTQLGYPLQKTTAPLNPYATQPWWNTATSGIDLYELYDGSQWLPSFAIDTANHLYVGQIGGGTQPSIAGNVTTDICTGVPQAEVTISGTASISSFGSACPNGIIKLVSFSGASTLVNSTNLIVPGNANFTTAAGDTAWVQSLGSGNYKIFAYQVGSSAPASSYAPINSPHFTGVPTAPTNSNAGDSSIQVATDAFVQSAISTVTSIPNPNIISNATATYDQANEGGAVSLSTGTPAFVADGWKAEFVSTGHSPNALVGCQRVNNDGPTGYYFAVKCTANTAAAAVGNGDFMILLLPIDATSLADTLIGTSNAANLCLSFEVKSSIPGYTFAAALQNYARTRSIALSFTQPVAGSWQQQSVCFAADTVNSGGPLWWPTTSVTANYAGAAYVVITVASGSTYYASSPNTWQTANVFGLNGMTDTFLTSAGATFEVTNVKLEIGAQATAFRSLSPPLEYQRIARWYQKSYLVGVVPGATSSSINGAQITSLSTASGWAGFFVRLPQPMVCQPTVTTYSATTGASGVYRNLTTAADTTSGGVTDQSQDSFVVVPGIGGTNGDAIAFAWVADCRL